MLSKKNARLAVAMGTVDIASPDDLVPCADCGRTLFPPDQISPTAMSGSATDASRGASRTAGRTRNRPPKKNLRQGLTSPR